MLQERAAYKVAVEAEIASTLEKFRCDMCAKSCVPYLL